MLTLAFVAAILGWMLYLRYTAKAAVGRSVAVLRERIPQLEGEGPMLVYCYRPNCGPCRSMKPVMEALARETGQVFEFDVSRDQETAQKIGIRATPTILVVAAGEVQEVLIGAQSPDRLKRLLESPA